MKATTIIAAIVLGLVCFFSLNTCEYVSQGEKAFFYNVSAGKKVNPQDNPLLPLGWNSTWGYNMQVFSVNGTNIDYDFTGLGTGSSKYDETIAWNSSEGVVMDSEYKLYGRVTDPWEFFVHYGELHYDFTVKGGKDVRVFAALRNAGRVIAEYSGEYAAIAEAEEIRTKPSDLKLHVLPRIQAYMKMFGFEITDMMFLKDFTYPEGNIINEARHDLTELNSEIRSQQQQLKNTTDQMAINVGAANMDAAKEIAKAQREASIIDAESNALATALQQQIEQIGIEGTLRLRSSEFLGNLSKKGVVKDAWVTQKSIFGIPLYPPVVK
ncbi:MAG: hypothetical protein JWP09_788 [Candidatus Taylorbacteria bacterium]|nr:hypothetical protein [Candidatus Taylorbacteria bacterium]